VTSLPLLERSRAYRTPEYYSELLCVAENLCALRNPKSTVVGKTAALNRILTMFSSNSPNKIKAALDFKLPYHLLISLHNPETRYESIQILYYISKGCKPVKLEKLSTKDTNQSMVNFYTTLDPSAARDLPTYVESNVTNVSAAI